MLPAGILASAYIAAAVLFILALGGLSQQSPAGRGHTYGIIGMIIAVTTTLMDPGVVSYWMIILGVIVGGSIGADARRRALALSLATLSADLVGVMQAALDLAVAYNKQVGDSR